MFANTHAGLSNYPTKTGEMHAGLHGRDALGELIGELHRRGVDVVVCCVMTFADWYWDNHPEARVVDASGREHPRNGQDLVDHGQWQAPVDIPIHGLKLRIRMDGRKPKGACLCCPSVPRCGTLWPQTPSRWKSRF